MRKEIAVEKTTKKTTRSKACNCVCEKDSLNAPAKNSKAIGSGPGCGCDPQSRYSTLKKGPGPGCRCTCSCSCTTSNPTAALKSAAQGAKFQNQAH